MFDLHPRLQQVAGALFQLQQKLEFKESRLLDEKLLNKLKDQVSLAETDLIAFKKYNFNSQPPTRSLYSLSEKHFKGDTKILVIAKISLLELYRCGASLYYSENSLAMTALIMSARIIGS